MNLEPLLVASGGDMSVQAATVANQGGIVSAGDAFALTANDLANAAGQIQSGGDATLQIANAIDTTTGSIVAGNALTVTATSLNNTQGLVGSIAGDTTSKTVSETLSDTV